MVVSISGKVLSQARDSKEYRWTPISAVSVIRGLPQPEKNLEN